MIVLLEDLLCCPPAPKRSTTNSTAMRVPLITGLPTSTLGSMLIRSCQFIASLRIFRWRLCRTKNGSVIPPYLKSFRTHGKTGRQVLRFRRCDPFRRLAIASPIKILDFVAEIRIELWRVHTRGTEMVDEDRQTTWRNSWDRPNEAVLLDRLFDTIGTVPQAFVAKTGCSPVTSPRAQSPALAGSLRMPNESPFEADRYAQEFAHDGYFIGEGVLSDFEVECLRATVAQIPDGEEVRRKRGVYGVRNLLEICPAARALARQATFVNLSLPFWARARSRFAPSTLTRFPAPTGRCSGTRTT